MKKIGFFFWVLGNLSFTQNNRDIDSLLLVKDYLLEIKQTVTVKKWNGEKQLKKVTNLIDQGMVYDKRFSILLNAVTSQDEHIEINRMHHQFVLILQTLALYQSDLKAKPNERPTNQEDLEFLISRIPPLVNDILHFCRLAEEEQMKNRH